MGSENPIPVDSWNDKTEEEIKASPYLQMKLEKEALEKRLSEIMDMTDKEILAKILLELETHHTDNRAIHDALATINHNITSPRIGFGINS